MVNVSENTSVVNGLDKEIEIFSEDDLREQARNQARVDEMLKRGRRREGPTAAQVERIKREAGVGPRQDVGDPEIERVWNALREIPAASDEWDKVTQIIRSYPRFETDADGAGLQMVERWVRERRPNNDPDRPHGRTLREDWDCAGQCIG